MNATNGSLQADQKFGNGTDHPLWGSQQTNLPALSQTVASEICFLVYLVKAELDRGGGAGGSIMCDDAICVSRAALRPGGAK